MTQYKSYPGGQAQKDELVAALEADREAGRFRQGFYSEFVDGEFQGTAIGCSIRALLGDGADFYNRKLLAHDIGIPVELCQIADRIFEDLGERHRDWPIEFAKAIPVGVDLRPALGRWIVWPLIDATRDDDVAAELRKRLADGGDVTLKERYAAEAAAELAAARSSRAVWNAYASKLADRLLLEIGRT